jgi:probable blue pigment (indigoidine) exporter
MQAAFRRRAPGAGSHRRGFVTSRPPPDLRGAFYQLGPVLTAAGMFTISDVAGKVALEGGTDVLSLLTFRSVFGIGLVFVWLRLGKPAVAPSNRAVWISLALGLLMVANLFGIFEAIALVPVSIAILTYFIYPLLTGVVAGMTGIDRLTPVGAVTALAAFGGLALIIGASATDLAVLGLLAAVGGAACRTAILLISRATLQDIDPRLVTWYTLWSSTLVFAALSVATWNWHWPQTTIGWAAFVAIGFATTAAIFAIYASTQRIGPFRTALYMNLEPFMTAVLSAVVLGDRLAPLQMLGGVIMITALCAFQLRR